MSTKWRCKKCGYDGDKMIFRYTDYSCCLASNDDEQEYLEKYETERGTYLEIDHSPVGCPKCGVWGERNFEEKGEKDGMGI